MKEFYNGRIVEIKCPVHEYLVRNAKIAKYQRLKKTQPRYSDFWQAKIEDIMEPYFP